MAKYRVVGYVKLPVLLAVESKDMEGAASSSVTVLHELGTRIDAHLKDKASQLAHDIRGDVDGEVTGITLED